MATIPRDLQFALESAIDSHGLANVVDALACICREKADHIRASYQDEALARRWDRCMSLLTLAETKVAGQLMETR